MFDRAFLAGKQTEGKGPGLKVEVLKYVFVLLFGLMFGYVLQSASVLVRAVDSFSRSSQNVGFVAYGR